jgi:16S rRNA (adenine1518-N6/adenine1519-N6)-dimethyltransferase
VKTGFNQRRKTLRNSLKSLIPPSKPELPFMDKRPEQLSVEEFLSLTSALEKVSE